MIQIVPLLLTIVASSPLNQQVPLSVSLNVKQETCIERMNSCKCETGKILTNLCVQYSLDSVQQADAFCNCSQLPENSTSTEVYIDRQRDYNCLQKFEFQDYDNSYIAFQTSDYDEEFYFCGAAYISKKVDLSSIEIYSRSAHHQYKLFSVKFSDIIGEKELACSDLCLEWFNLPYKFIVQPLNRLFLPFYTNTSNGAGSSFPVNYIYEKCMCVTKTGQEFDVGTNSPKK
jgi:hypothetical protein